MIRWGMDARHDVLSDDVEALKTALLAERARAATGAMYTLDQRLAEAGTALGVPTKLLARSRPSPVLPTMPMAGDWTDEHSKAEHNRLLQAMFGRPRKRCIDRLSVRRTLPKSEGSSGSQVSRLG